MIDIIWGIANYVMMLALPLLVVHLIYTGLLAPYLAYRRYKRYPNVYVSKKFTPLLGDVKDMLEDVTNGRMPYYNVIEKLDDFKDHDLIFYLLGIEPQIKICSMQAHKEFNALVPSKIDRKKETKGFGKLVVNSFVNVKADQCYKDRKKMFLNAVTLNATSKYIPDMLRVLKTNTDKWKVGDQFNGFAEISKITFDIFVHILFGKDVDSLIEKEKDFIMPDNSIVKLNFKAFFSQLVKDHVMDYFHPASSFAKFLNTFALINPFKRNRKNKIVFFEFMREIISETKDKESILSQIRDNDTFDEGMILDDLLSLMIAAGDTSSRAISSTLYFIKKYPDVLLKLEAELKKHGLDKFNGSQDRLDKDAILNLDYLNWVVKESLRIDPPTQDSLLYEAYEDVEICGVKIPKGSEIQTAMLVANNSNNEWIEPRKFIPERFDPESDYFYKPSSKSQRSPYSYIPFSHGFRSCPGKTMAMLQIKLIVSYMTLKFDYSIPADVLSRDDVGFGVGSELPLPLSITKS